jgi:rod shape-determining protein MreD
MIPYSRRFELVFWTSVPAMITLFLIIICLAPKHITGLEKVMPILPLMPVFYWGMLHAREMPYWFVFLAGLLVDSATGQPLGLSSLLYIIFMTMLHAQRKYFHKEGFVIKWGYFAGLLLVMTVLNWVCLSLYYMTMLPSVPALVQWLMTVGFYPLMHAGFEIVDKRIHERRWQILHGR